jgi:hypothetical protein
MGHGCDKIDEPEIPIPNNWIYVTSGICGKEIYGSEIFDNFAKYFFENTKNIFENPCINFDKLQEFNDKATNIQFNITFPSNVPEYQAIRQSCINSNLSLLTDWMFKDQSGQLVQTQNENECTSYHLRRSGIYRSGNTPDLTDSLINLRIIEIHKREEDNEIIIPFVYIEYIYLNSIYPTTEQIKKLIIKKFSNKYINEGIPLSDFKSVMKIYDISLSELFEFIKAFDKSGENSDGAVIYNLTCRSPCNNAQGFADELKMEAAIRSRRRASFSALNTFNQNK